MIQRTEKGKIARQYFINCEKKLKAVKKLSPMELMELQFKVLKEQKEKITQVENRVDKLEMAKEIIINYKAPLVLENEIKLLNGQE